MLKLFAFCLAGGMLLLAPVGAQESATSSKPTEHVIGTVSAVDAAAHTVTVKEDKTGTEHSILLQNTRTLLKVAPGAKDLKSATRITADDLAVGDRVDVRGSKPEDNPSAIAARSVILMSARDLEQAHQVEAEAWQHSTAGLVSSVDPSTGRVVIAVRTPEGPGSIAIEASGTTAFTRYSPEDPKTPSPSQLTDIKPGDQVRVIGEKSADGSTITAEKIYSGAFRTVGGTVTSISADGKEMTIRSAGTNQPLEVTLNDESAIRKLPPEMALRLAMRLNPTYRPAQGGAGTGGSPRAGGNGNAAGAPPYGAKAGEASESAQANQSDNAGGAPSAGHRPGMGAGGGSLSQMVEGVPKIGVSDLKPGDAVIVAGAEGESSRFVATSVIAGVEPILRAAPPRQGQSQNSDWNLGMNAPAEQ